MQIRLQKWKQPIILLTSIGFAGVGDWIYLVAINLLVYQMTGSAAAVAGLWIISPIVNVLTKFWTGSFIDYRSKRKIIISTYVIRACFVFLLPFSPNIFFTYGILIVLSIAKSFFSPASIVYITQLISVKIRKRYNAIQSITTSGAFIIGPAIAGALILFGGVDFTLFVNACFFIVSALCLFLLPETEQHNRKRTSQLTFSQIKSDFVVVLDFFKEYKYITLIYTTYLVTTILSFAMDTQEVVFTQQVIGLSELDYSLLISITGIGSILGAVVVSIFAKRFSLRSLISLGILMSSIGYLFYAFSISFLTIAIGFIILGFFNAFLNTGITTFYQNNVPTTLMGRVTSIFQLILSLIQIDFVLLVGFIADIIPLRITIICLALGMLIATFVTVFNVYRPSKKQYFDET